MASARLNRWAVELGQYNMTMQHISGAKHTQADIVSRLGYLLTTNIDDDIHNIEDNNMCNMDISNLFLNCDFLNNIEKSSLDFKYKNNYYINKINNINAISHAGYQPLAIKYAQKKDKLCNDIICYMKLDKKKKDMSKKIKKNVNFNNKIEILNNDNENWLDMDKHINNKRQYKIDYSKSNEKWCKTLTIDDNKRLKIDIDNDIKRIEINKKINNNLEQNLEIENEGQNEKNWSKNYIKKLKKIATKCEIIDNILYYKGGIFGKKLYVPESMRNELLYNMHESKTSQHLGQNYTFYKLSKRYNWPGMYKDVIEHVKTCIKCNTRNENRKHKRQMILDYHDTEQLFDVIIIDVYGKLKKSKNGNNFIITFTCAFSRWVEAFPVKDAKAHTVAEILTKNILLRYGPARILQSDRGKNFLSETIKEVCKLFNINKVDTSSYHPQSNALLERIHQDFNNMISKYINDDHDDWDDIIPFVLWAHRTKRNSGRGFSPYEIVYGRCAETFPDITFYKFEGLKKDTVAIIKSLVRRKKKMNEIIEENRNDFIENSLKKSLPNINSVKEFESGDLCFIRNKLYDNDGKTSKKFQIRFDGPMEIIKKIDDTTYEVKNLVTNSIITKNVDDIKAFHLRHEKDNYKTLTDLPLHGQDHGWDTIDLDEVEIKRIINSRIKRDGKNMPFTSYQCETIDGLIFWEDERRLNCTALINDYNINKQHEHDLEKTLYKNKKTRLALRKAKQQH